MNTISDFKGRTVSLMQWSALFFLLLIGMSQQVAARGSLARGTQSNMRDGGQQQHGRELPEVMEKQYRYREYGKGKGGKGSKSSKKKCKGMKGKGSSSSKSSKSKSKWYCDPVADGDYHYKYPDYGRPKPPASYYAGHPVEMPAEHPSAHYGDDDDDDDKESASSPHAPYSSPAAPYWWYSPSAPAEAPDGTRKLRKRE